MVLDIGILLLGCLLPGSGLYLHRFPTVYSRESKAVAFRGCPDDST